MAVTDERSRLAYAFQEIMARHLETDHDGDLTGTGPASFAMADTALAALSLPVSNTGENAELVKRLPIAEKLIRISDACRREDGTDIPLGEQCREAATANSRAAPLSDSTKAEIIARQIWAYFNGGPDGAKWFDENKSLGGPSHIIALCQAVQTITREGERANSRAEVIGAAVGELLEHFQLVPMSAQQRKVYNNLRVLLQQEGE